MPPRRRCDHLTIRLQHRNLRNLAIVAGVLRDVRCGRAHIVADDHHNAGPEPLSGGVHQWVGTGVEAHVLDDEGDPAA